MPSTWTSAMNLPIFPAISYTPAMHKWPRGSSSHSLLWLLPMVTPPPYPHSQQQGVARETHRQFHQHADG
eukprot:3051037-Pleurochrysis_carterae.AAC.1